MSLITKLELDTDRIFLNYIETEDEIKDICFDNKISYSDSKKQNDLFYEDFTEYVRTELDEINNDKINQAFEDFIEENITDYNGYVKIECEEDMVDCWSHKEWCKVFVKDTD